MADQNNKCAACGGRAVLIGYEKNLLRCTECGLTVAALAAAPAVPAVDALTERNRNITMLAARLVADHSKTIRSMFCNGAPIGRMLIDCLAPPSTAPDRHPLADENGCWGLYAESVLAAGAAPLVGVPAPDSPPEVDDLASAFEYPKASLTREDWDPKTRKPFQLAAHVLPPTRGTGSQHALPEPGYSNSLADRVFNLPCNWKGMRELHDAVLLGHTMACEQAYNLVMEYEQSQGSRCRAQGGTTNNTGSNFAAHPADAGAANLDSLAQAGLAAALENHAKGENTSLVDAFVRTDGVEGFHPEYGTGIFFTVDASRLMCFPGDPEATSEQMGGAQVAKNERTKLREMRNDDGDIGWYFDCEGHYIDVERDENGKYTVFFRNRDDGLDAWLDQAERAAEEEATERKPMTVAEIWQLAPRHSTAADGIDPITFTRAIEQHHGITGGGK